MASFKIGVLIATALKRSDLLFNRALLSVLNQTRKADYIVIVDDNTDASESALLKEGILSFNNPRLVYLKNQKTQGHSGSGAWNSGIDWYKNVIDDNDYIAILDDDDSWDSTYLEKMESTIKNFSIGSPRGLPDLCAAFLKRSDCRHPHTFQLEDFSLDSFLLGNVGIQGSNMFVKLNVLRCVNGFDEKLDSCTDRDFLIRLIQTFPNLCLVIVPEVLVNHFAWQGSITYNQEAKNSGLTKFFEKYIGLYSIDILKKSLERAEKLFGYAQSDYIWKLFHLVHSQPRENKVIIGVAVHNGLATIRRCLESILSQRGFQGKLWIVIVDDNSTDKWEAEVKDLLALPNILSIKVKNNSVYKTRNDIHDFVRRYFKENFLLGRLDCDDEFSDKDVLSKIERISTATQADVVLAGNYLRQDGMILDRVNRATKRLLEPEYVLERLDKMAKGDPEAELPSCNTFLTSRSLLNYPDERSAEDHFLLTELLLGPHELKIVVAEDILSTVYNLSGNSTAKNKKSEAYLETRKRLYQKGANLCKIKNANKKH